MHVIVCRDRASQLQSGANIRLRIGERREHVRVRRVPPHDPHSSKTLLRANPSKDGDAELRGCRDLIATLAEPPAMPDKEMYREIAACGRC